MTVNMPFFTDFELVENQLFSYSRCVIDANKISTYDYIKQNDKYIFQIYIIEDTYARWYIKEDKNYAKKVQKKRREKIKEIELKIIENEI